MEKEHKRQTHTNCVFIAVAASRMACRFHCVDACALRPCRWTMMCLFRWRQAWWYGAHPPLGVLAWVGGGGMALRASGTPIYILIYILRFISLF